MSLEALNGIGYGGVAGQRLNIVLQELQSRTHVILAGTTAVTQIPLAGIEYTDTVQAVIRFNAGVPSDVTSEVSITDRRAVGTLTLAAVVVGDTAVVNGKTYTAVSVPVVIANSGGLGSRNFNVGASDTLTAANLAAAINSYADGVVTASSAAAVVTIKAVALGVGGNAVTLGATLHFTRSAATLAGGTATQGILLSTTNTTGNTLMVTWAKKPSKAV